MPTLPLMIPTPHPDASRKVTAPGGYEWWRFDASSDDGKLHLVAALHVGHAFDPHYLRRYALYRRFPTRMRPPVPAEFCATTFALLEQGRPALRFSAAAAATADDFTAADDGRGVRLGASHMNRGSDGVVRLHLRGTYYDRTIAVNLSFRPQLDASCEIDLAPGGRDASNNASDTGGDDARVDAMFDAALREGASDEAASFAAATEIGSMEDAPTSPSVSARAMSTASPHASASGSLRATSVTNSFTNSSSLSSHPAGRHGWVVVDPLCDVDGEISLFVSESGGPPRVTPFAGVGCHDHRFGTRPLGELSDRWVSGRAVFEDRAILFHQVGDATFTCRAGAGAGMRGSSPRISNEPLKISGSATSRWGIGYPEAVELPGGVRLMRPRVVASSMASVTVAYDAVGNLETGRALLQVVRPRRLPWSPR